MCFHELCDDGEADATAGDRAGRVASVEAFEHVRAVLDGDAGTAVAHGQCCCPFCRVLSYVQFDVAAGWREPDGVAQQVRDNLGQAGRVTVDDRRFEMTVHLLLVCVRHRIECVGCMGGDLCEVASFDRNTRSGERSVGLGERAEIVDEAPEAEDVVVPTWPVSNDSSVWP